MRVSSDLKSGTHNSIIKFHWKTSGIIKTYAFTIFIKIVKAECVTTAAVSNTLLYLLSFELK